MLARVLHDLRAHRISRFLIVGAYNAFFGYAVFVGLYYWLGDGVHYNVLLVVSYVISVTNSYLLQRHFVFRTQSRRLAEFLRFNVVNLGGMFVNMALLYLAVTYVTPNVAIAQALALVVTIAFIYVGHSYYSFKIAGHADGKRH